MDTKNVAKLCPKIARNSWRLSTKSARFLQETKFRKIFDIGVWRMRYDLANKKKANLKQSDQN